MTKNSKIITDSKQFSNIYNHTKSELLQITIDKLKLKLIDYEASVSDASLFWTILGNLIGILAVFITADFKEFLGINAEVWKAFFMFVLALLLLSLFYLLLSKKFPQKITSDSIIEDLKNKDKPTENK